MTIIVCFNNYFDAITAVDELRRFDVVPILPHSTRGRLRFEPAGDVTVWLWWFRRSLGVKGGTRKAGGDRHADEGYGEGVAMVAFSMNVVIVHDISRSLAPRKLRKASCAWGLTIPMHTKLWNGLS